MSTVDGTWNTIVNTPIGQQKAKLTVIAKGDQFTGQMSTLQGDLAVEQGKVDGNKLSWVSALEKPMPMRLEFQVEINEDIMEGTVKMGNFGIAPVRGEREV